MSRLLMALIALGMGLSLAGCDGAGYAQPAPRWERGPYPSNPMGGGGG